MAKFPTEVESSVTVKVPIEKAYKYMWDVVGSSKCIPGLASCKKVGADTYRFLYAPRSTAGIAMTVQYTAAYEGDGKGSIKFVSATGKGDNTDVDGEIRLQKAGTGTKITLRQMVAPDTPVPSLLQRLVKSFAEKEAGATVKEYLANVKEALEAKA
ncbi:MAG TPA: SRPBCC family protein [Candidatus Dormibacteraeota bacterium]|nr:SRPBCC family protein [Candidatus Dormibacteraeota bacterium]